MEPIMNTDPRVILIAVDNTEGSEIAFQWALKNYCKPSDHLRLIYVQKPLSEIERRLSSQILDKLELQSNAASRAVVDKFMKRAALADIDCDWKISTGDAREAICKEVLRVCADVLIVGSRGLSAVKKALLGSVSEYCAHHCACPVIIVKAKDHNKEQGYQPPETP
eukprot:TRINITY_DN1841_c0_g1_i1.p1 TRINITY_DN1841_c0_g1~~TRINITY_DN1841_c0_g1_i1.p1  ORF type:complete len:166 (+),score=10.45 TRINITY_DN1841_c0_g1_i1:239-736(+)